jgi:catechol 2,3-dioxygenase-like lactoylglutathione lyase family enzyme
VTDGPPAVERLVVAADPAAWSAAGFRVDDGVARVGSVPIELAGTESGKRIVSCVLSGVRPGDFDGLPIEASGGARSSDSRELSPPHPNGVTRLDHVVAFTPDLDRTVAAGQALGLDLRRVRDEPAPAGSPRQAFFRLGEAMLEIAQAPDGSPLPADSPARFYGLAFVVDDIDATAAALGDRCGEPRAAIQPGRRIATVRREAGLGLPVALMTPRPAS